MTRIAETSGRMAHRRQRILVVDDDVIMLAVMQDALEHAGYRVATLDRSHDVPAAVRAHAPDLVILDVLMPELDGYQVIARLTEAGMHLPLIIMTGLSLTLTTLGGHRVMHKPVGVPDLLAAVADVIGPPVVVDAGPLT